MTAEGLIQTARDVMREFKDDNAHVLAILGNSVAYKVRDTIYLIPATIRAVYTNGDNDINYIFEYPCEMKYEDLIEL